MSVNLNVSEKHIVSIFRAENGDKWRQNPEEQYHHPNRRENLKSHNNSG
jgi:hypothetical protein